MSSPPPVGWASWRQPEAGDKSTHYPGSEMEELRTEK